MTIKQCIKKKGWQIDCDSKLGRYMSVDIGFVNSDGKDDETQFDIKAYDVDELDNLFADFCKENGFKKNTVYSICIVKIADTIEELEE